APTMMTSYSDLGSGDVHCCSHPLWARNASRAKANTEYFRIIQSFAELSAVPVTLAERFVPRFARAVSCPEIDIDFQAQDRTFMHQ
ncbi:hypothetical protein, partial [Providencia rettgeri]|uniref:hypothetical protein n=1 Tax=Providencia rettgeri TaxID=587 RepID=UPI0029D885B4